MKVLSVFAHREDHIVFGWPVNQSNEYDKYLFTCTNDMPEAVNNSCRSAKINYVGNASVPNGFSIQENRRLPLRYEQIKLALTNVIDSIKPDVLFTHNPMGEYGHYDHKMVFQIVCNEFKAYDLMITDIIAKSSHCHEMTSISREYAEFYKSSKKVITVTPDNKFYIKQALIFTQYKGWTENINLNIPLYPVKTSLYLIQGENK